MFCSSLYLDQKKSTAPKARKPRVAGRDFRHDDQPLAQDTQRSLERFGGVNGKEREETTQQHMTRHPWEKVVQSHF